MAQVLKPTAGNEPYSPKQLLIWCFGEESGVKPCGQRSPICTQLIESDDCEAHDI